MYFGLHQVFAALPGLSLVAAGGGYYSLWSVGFSLRWFLLLWSTVPSREVHQKDLEELKLLVKTAKSPGVLVKLIKNLIF